MQQVEAGFQDRNAHGMLGLSLVNGLKETKRVHPMMFRCINHVIYVEFPVSNTSKPRVFSEISCLRTCYGGNKSNVFFPVLKLCQSGDILLLPLESHH